jgi:hypothetical protein
VFAKSQKVPWIGPEIELVKLFFSRARIFPVIAGLLFILLGSAYAAEKIDWKPIPDAVLQIDAHPAKLWNLYRAGKKSDPLLLQLGNRMLVIYIHNLAIYEIKPEQLEHKGEDLLWRETDKPEKPLATSEWSTKDIGSAFRIRVKLENRLLDIQISQVPDLRRGIY